MIKSVNDSQDTRSLCPQKNNYSDPMRSMFPATGGQLKRVAEELMMMRDKEEQRKRLLKNDFIRVDSFDRRGQRGKGTA